MAIAARARIGAAGTTASPASTTSSARLRREWMYAAPVTAAHPDRRRSEDDHRSAAQAAGIHELVRARRLLGRDLRGDAQLQPPGRRELAQPLEPVGALEDGADAHRPHLDLALGRAVVPAADD